MNVRLNKNQKIKINSSRDIYNIMKQILLRENKYGITKEHFWVVGLGIDNRIMYIELVSLGGINSATVNPNEVFTLAAQRNVPKLILVHNHPGESLNPTEDDKDLTDRLIQAARLVSTEVIDHLIITPEEYYSFVDNQLFAKLLESKKYVLYYELEDKAREQGKEQGISEGLKEGLKIGKIKWKKEGKEEGEKKGIIKGKKEREIEIAKNLLSMGLKIENVAKATGLSKAQITKLAKPKPGKKT